MFPKLISLTFCALLAFVAPSLADDKDFHDQDLSKRDFTGQALNGADFSDAVLKGAVFTNASLKKALFKGADLTNTGFAGADLTGADLRETVGLYAAGILNGANLEGVTFGITFGVKFRGANLKKCKITSLLGEADFSGADLRGANLRALSFDPGVRFRNAVYDEETAWPEGFDPKAAGAMLAKPDAAAPDAGAVK